MLQYNLTKNCTDPKNPATYLMQFFAPEFLSYEEQHKIRFGQHQQRGRPNESSMLHLSVLTKNESMDGSYTLYDRPSQPG